ncbi:hypothetical protein MANES_12G049450v8 [Manihot esculenta]|uniref:Uncharacterized protein n=1 Tax=Manihot esculenta TaxID=3983 RepID=A0ACB7GR57_MANES|nr:hypothetical protein MANES_12G049450v8 [Manihot esculenta]
MVNRVSGGMDYGPSRTRIRRRLKRCFFFQCLAGYTSVAVYGWCRERGGAEIENTAIIWTDGCKLNLAWVFSVAWFCGRGASRLIG